MLRVSRAPMKSEINSMSPQEDADAQQQLDENSCLGAQSAEHHVVEHRRARADHDGVGQLLPALPVNRVEQRPPVDLGVEAVRRRQHPSRPDTPSVTS